MGSAISLATMTDSLRSHNSNPRKMASPHVVSNVNLKMTIPVQNSVQVRHSRAILEQSPHGGFELLEIDRLRQVGVEAGFLGALDIFLHA
jgi:hypothetical protein